MIAMAGTLPNFNKTDPWSIAQQFLSDQNKEIANREYMTHQMNMKTGANVRETAEKDTAPSRRYQVDRAAGKAGLENLQDAEAAGLVKDGSGSRYRGGKMPAGADPEIFNEFMEGVKEKGLTNPYGLAVVAGTGQIESGWSKNNLHRQWDDLGKPSGLLMSWRAERLNAAREYAKKNGEQQPSARTQGRFLADENPQMIEELNNAGSLAEAQKIINKNWRFKGWETGEGSSKARLDASAAYLKQFGANPLTAKERNVQSASLATDNAPATTPKYDPDGKEYFEIQMTGDGYKKAAAGLPNARGTLVPDLSRPVGPKGEVFVRQYTGKVDPKAAQPVVTPASTGIVSAQTTPAAAPKPLAGASGFTGEEDEF